MRKLVKKLLSLLVICFIFIFYAFTYEGELNPDDFYDIKKWKIIKTQPDPSAGIVWINFENLDLSIPIDIVVSGWNFNGKLLVYYYFKYGEPYLYTYNAEKDKYVYSLNIKQKNKCIECHSKELKKYIKWQ